mgnify:CR=1 FL=1
MPASCHSVLPKIRDNTALTIALAGNPNVGKSSIFNHLTGMGVVTANYPGKTVELNMAVANYDHMQLGIIDLPGTYALGAISEDQWVARQAVLESRPDVIIMILDATNLARNLYMLLQFLDLGVPIVAALNIVDQAERQGISTDAKKLSDRLGIPVIPTVATSGKGLDELVHAAVSVARDSCRCRESHAGLSYGQDVEEIINLLAAHIATRLEEVPYGLPPRAVASLLLENDPDFADLIGSTDAGKEILSEVRSLAELIESKHGEPAPIRIARERHGLAGAIAAEVQTSLEHAPRSLADRLWHYTTSPVTGLPILGIVLACIFAFLFYVGSFLSTLFTDIWTALVSPIMGSAIHFLFGDSIIARIMVWGPDAGIQATLAVGIPYILTFYFIIALLEDSGYLNSVAFLTDRIMHNLGLHGRAVIPLVAGAGCNVPAIIGTRVLSTMRERIIASTLIVLIPCSARTAVIMGAVYLYAGWLPAIGIYATVFALVTLAGLALNKMLPGESTGLVMEVFPFRSPSLKTTLKRTWYQFKEFVFVATPIVLGGSLVLGALYETGWVWTLAVPMSPIVEGWLGLPAVAGLTLIFAVLRKELALQVLIALAIVQYGRGAENLLSFMNPTQLFVYALVNTIYVPCVATVAVLGRELGWKRSLLVVVSTIAAAVAVGGIAYRVLLLLGG